MLSVGLYSYLLSDQPVVVNTVLKLILYYLNIILANTLYRRATLGILLLLLLSLFSGALCTGFHTQYILVTHAVPRPTAPPPARTVNRRLC